MSSGRYDTMSHAGTSISSYHDEYLRHLDTVNRGIRRRLGVVVSVVGRINEVNQYRARLVHDG